MQSDTQQLAERACGLLKAAQGGDPAALGQLMELYRAYLLAIADAELTGMLRSKAGPSDIVQDTFLEAQRLFERFQGREGDEFRAWLRAILLNKTRELHNLYLASQKREAGREQSIDESGEFGRMREALPDGGSSPSGKAVRNEQLDAVMTAMARLSETHRQVLLWRNWDRLPFAEIGRRLERSEDAARMLFGRALECLREEVERGHASGGPASADGPSGA